MCGMQGKRYMPFGDGLRQCIGMSLAKMDYLTALAVLTSHFTMELAPEVMLPFSLAHRSLPLPFFQVTLSEWCRVSTMHVHLSAHHFPER